MLDLRPSALLPSVALVLIALLPPPPQAIAQAPAAHPLSQAVLRKISAGSAASSRRNAVIADALARFSRGGLGAGSISHNAASWRQDMRDLAANPAEGRHSAASALATLRGGRNHLRLGAGATFDRRLSPSLHKSGLATPSAQPSLWMALYNWAASW